MSAGRKAAAFHFTDAERKVLAEAVPDPHWVDKLDDDDWGKLASFPHHEEFRADKVGFIARELERVARECLEEQARFRPARQDADNIRAAARDMRKLQVRLLKLTPYGTTFAVAFLGLGRLSGDNVDHASNPYRHEVFLNLLDEMIHNEEWVDETIASWHADNVFTGRHHPAFKRFVDAAITFWHVWTDKVPGASKAHSGPAARFLCAAANPVIAFAEGQGLHLRHTSEELTVEAAGELIIEMRRAEPPLD